MGLMLTEFIDFVDSVLPSVNPEAKNRAKAAIEQFAHEGNTFEYLLPNRLPELSQGDIISDIKFSYFKEDGSQHTYKARGMIISTSCHIDQKEVLNIVPVLPMEFFVGDINKRNQLKCIYDYMYFPENSMEDYFVDFSKVNTYNKRLIMNGIETGSIQRLFSLSQIGFYLFIIKLTVFLMRKEDDDTMAMREATCSL